MERRSLSFRDLRRKDSSSSLKESGYMSSPSQPKRGSSLKEKQPRESLIARKVKQYLEPSRSTESQDENRAENEQGMPDDQIGTAPLKLRKSTSAIDDRRNSDTRMRKRKGSDSSLLSAKSLILNVLSVKEQKERRLTAKLEKIEAEIRKTSLGGNTEKRRLSSRSRRSSIQSYLTSPGRSPRLGDAVGFLDSQHTPTIVEGELAEHFTDDHDERQEHDLFDDEEEEFDREEDDCLTIISGEDEDDRVQQLEKAHSKLKQEHKGLQSEIKRMTSQLEWIESQLQATKGHAKCLSKSTSDWAGMMKQIYHANTVQEQRRVIRQGTMVVKHSMKKRGCGPRFLAFDAVNKVLYWSKTMLGATEICKQVNRVNACQNFPYALASRPSFDQSSDPSSEETSHGCSTPVLKASNTSSVQLCPEMRVLYGREELACLRFSKASIGAGQACSEHPETIVVIQPRSSSSDSSSSSQPIVFEFFDPEVAESFALGLKLAVHGDDQCEEPMEDNEIAPESTASSDSIAALGENQDKTTPQSSPSNYEQEMPRPNVAARILHGTSGEASQDSHNSSFRSEAGSVGSNNRRGSIRSLNSNFELKSLDLASSSQSFRVSQLQRDLSQVRSKKSYLNVLIGSAIRSQLVLPLQSGRAQRNLSADRAQMLKDLKRERAILLNAVKQPLGNEDNTDKLISSLKEQLRDVLHNLETDDPSNSTPIVSEASLSYWCDEILLAASRTVIEGDVYSVCHKLLTGPSNVLLMPADANCNASPMEIFVARDGLVTIESETEYRVVRIDPEEGIEEEWAKVHARCIEHLSLSSSSLTLENGEEIDERNIRSVRLEFEP